MARPNTFKTKKGSITINGGWVVSESDTLVALEFDLKAKYAEIHGISNKKVLHLGASKETLHAHKTSKWTEVSFPKYKDFDIYLSEITRYTLRVCLINQKGN